MMAAPFPLADWLREQGGTVTNLSWPIDFGDDGGRGVGLSSAVPKGSILLQVPSSAMFTPPVARALLVSAFPDSSYFKDEEECVGEQLLAAGLLCERRKGPSSRWAPWLASLPSPAEYATILDMWPESALPLLGSPRLLHRRARSLHRLRSGFEACSRAFGSPAELSFTFEDYCWAICSVRSRTFLADLGGSVFEADVAIVPFGDM